MRIKLTYFKDSGKYYTEGEYESSLEFEFDVYREVRAFNGVRIMPGLSTGRWDGYVLVCPVDGVPALIDLTEMQLPIDT